MKAAGGQTALMSRYPPRRENGRTRPWLGEAGEGSLVGLARRCWPPVLALPGVGTGARGWPREAGRPCFPVWWGRLRKCFQQELEAWKVRAVGTHAGVASFVWREKSRI